LTDLLPRPRSFESLAGSFRLAHGASISGPAALVDGVRVALSVLDLRPSPAGTVSVRHTPKLGAEAYALSVTPDGITIEAGDRAGAFYAGQTLRQMLPDAAFRSVSADDWIVRCARIEDAPRFSWRGVLLDVTRHFLPKREVLRMIDLMAVHKLNRLHLHLTDDQGWRIESPTYPRLHQVGSHRPQTISSYLKEEPPTFDGTPHGGYYTLADLAEIAAYAAARSVTIMPEIDVPGHASAIIAAHPALGTNPIPGVLERWGITTTILSPLPATVDFLIAVFDELIGAIGKVPYFGIGGDECVLDEWAASKEISAYQHSLGLNAPSDLHAWFLRRLADLLAERGIRAVVWDEAFVSGGLRPDTIVMPWRQMGVGRRAAAAGYDIVAIPCFPNYFDYAEASSAEEPLALGDATTVADVAAFAPASASWEPAERARVLGAQFSLFTEFIPNPRVLDYRAWPRGCAAAEVVWAGRTAADFERRLRRHLGRLDALGVEYRPLDGPHPWQRGGTGARRHRPGVISIDQVLHLEENALTADSTRPLG
jgi:hexosaminidase